jgi:hypothetical protein
VTQKKGTFEKPNKNRKNRTKNFIDRNWTITTQGPCSAVLPTVHGCHYAFHKFPFLCHLVFSSI